MSDSVQTHRGALLAALLVAALDVASLLPDNPKITMDLRSTNDPFVRLKAAANEYTQFINGSGRLPRKK